MQNNDATKSAWKNVEDMKRGAKTKSVVRRHANAVKTKEEKTRDVARKLAKDEKKIALNERMNDHFC
jgi:hypothetical protein